MKNISQPKNQLGPSYGGVGVGLVGVGWKLLVGLMPSPDANSKFAPETWDGLEDGDFVFFWGKRPMFIGLLLLVLGKCSQLEHLPQFSGVNKKQLVSRSAT